MNVYLRNLWNHLRASFWLLPTLMAIGVCLFSFVTIKWDRALENHDISLYSIWQGGAEGARQLLSTIAGSVITITGVVFSMTVVSLALASTQYSSRLLRNFMGDFITQVVLGTFISTSLYSLLILRTIRNDTHEFIPNLSITISIGFAILSLSLLIYFIHHLSVRVQASDVTFRVSQDLISMIESSLQDSQLVAKSEEKIDESHLETSILASKIGYLQAIDYQSLYGIAKQNQIKINIYFRAGNFISKENILAKVNSNALSKKTYYSIAKAFIIGKDRSPTQDLEYAVDQLVAIALRALGSNVNDTFTANTCIDYLGSALKLLCKKELNPPYYETNPFIKIASKHVTFEGIVDAAFNQVRQYGSHSPSILIHLLETLITIIPSTQNSEQRNALEKHAKTIKSAGKRLLEDQDRQDVEERLAEFNKSLKATS